MVLKLESVKNVTVSAHLVRENRALRTDKRPGRPLLLLRCARASGRDVRFYSENRDCGLSGTGCQPVISGA